MSCLLQPSTLLCLLFMLPATVLHAQESNNTPMHLPRITSGITLDGRIEEPAWQRIEPLPVSMLYPTYHGEMTEHTEIRVAYDDQYLYASIRAYHSDPSNLRANTYMRDRWGTDDEFTLVLDTFNDRENAMMFMVNPTGNRIDFLVFNNAEPNQGPYLNRDWNTYWDAETVMNEEGWFAEMRIPFSSLQFNTNENGDVIMGLKAYRWMPGKYENHQFPAAPPSLRNAYLKPSTAQPVLLRNIENHRPVYITPYALGGLEQIHRLNEPGTEFVRNDELTGEIGGDIKYSISNELTMDLTANTDFAQVEADAQQVNLGRFPLFFPEKRQFFQERSGIFEFDTGGRTSLFFSRRIGLDGQGNTVPIIGGGRLTGRAGSWDIGMLDMQTANSANLPSENFGVFRFRRNVLNDNSFMGGIYTHRLGADGSFNLGYGVDGGFQITPDDYLILRWAQTYDDRQGWGLSSGRFRGRLERSRLEGIGYYTDVTWSGRDYQPDLGFITARNFTSVTSELSHGWIFEDKNTRLRSFRGLIWNSTRFRNTDGVAENISTSLVFLYQFKQGNGGVVWQNITREDLPVPITLSDEAEIPVGRYAWYTLGIDYHTSPGNLLRGSLNLQLGSFYDGTKYTVSVGPSWNLTPKVELGGSYTLNRILLPERDQEFTSHIARLRALTSFNTRLSFQSFIQFNNLRELLLSNLRIRYNFAEGNDLWIVYNEGFNTNRDPFEPNRPFSDARSILVKYTYTFNL